MEPTVYITPNLAFTTNKVSNPYIVDLAEGWEQIGAKVIRSPYANYIRTADIAIYLNQTDILMLNWPEELYVRIFGPLQIVLLKKLILNFRKKGGKVVWTMHNRLPHYTTAREKQHNFLNWVRDHCDLVIVHAKEGLQLLPDDQVKLFFPHPFQQALTPNTVNSVPFEYDALIWGNLSPYKGIDQFLDSLHKGGLQNTFKIMVCGRCNDNAYAAKLKQYETSSIQIRNEFISDIELSDYFRKTRTVLFPHSGDSILTSGTLAQSLSHLKTVIAPHRGNFRDFAEEGLLHSFTSFDQIPTLLTYCQQEPEAYLLSPYKIHSEVTRYGWADFTQAIVDKLYGTLKIAHT